jgi:hypothetical protein
MRFRQYARKREFVAISGLMSYAPSVTEAYRYTGGYIDTPSVVARRACELVAIISGQSQATRVLPGLEFHKVLELLRQQLDVADLHFPLRRGLRSSRSAAVRPTKKLRKGA